VAEQGIERNHLAGAEMGVQARLEAGDEIPSVAHSSQKHAWINTVEIEIDDESLGDAVTAGISQGLYGVGCCA